MTITAILELRLNPDTLDEGRAVLRRVLDETRAFDGNLGVTAIVDGDDPAHLIVREEWQSAESDAAYRAFRAGPGAITDLAPLLAAAPVLTKGTTDTEV